MPNKHLAAALGALTGLVSLVAMIRLVSGAFTEGMSTFAWVAILLAMLPWIGYAAWRAPSRSSQPAGRSRGAAREPCRMWCCMAFRPRPGDCVELLIGCIRRHLGQRLAGTAPYDRREVRPHRGVASR